MPVLIKIDYTISGPVTAKIYRLDFDHELSADYAGDKSPNPPFIMKSQPPTNGKPPYVIYPSNQYINIFVVGVTAPGIVNADPILIDLTFTKVAYGTFVPDPKGSPKTVQRTISLDKTGKYFLNENVQW